MDWQSLLSSLLLALMVGEALSRSSSVTRETMPTGRLSFNLTATNRTGFNCTMVAAKAKKFLISSSEWNAHHPEPRYICQLMCTGGQLGQYCIREPNSNYPGVFKVDPALRSMDCIRIYKVLPAYSRCDEACRGHESHLPMDCRLNDYPGQGGVVRFFGGTRHPLPGLNCTRNGNRIRPNGRLRSLIGCFYKRNFISPHSPRGEGEYFYFNHGQVIVFKTNLELKKLHLNDTRTIVKIKCQCLHGEIRQQTILSREDLRGPPKIGVGKRPRMRMDYKENGGHYFYGLARPVKVFTRHCR